MIHRERWYNFQLDEKQRTELFHEFEKVADEVIDDNLGRYSFSCKEGVSFNVVELPVGSGKYVVDVLVKRDYKRGCKCSLPGWFGEAVKRFSGEEFNLRTQKRFA